jgi:hypothetical protein
MIERPDPHEVDAQREGEGAEEGKDQDRQETAVHGQVAQQDANGRARTGHLIDAHGRSLPG